MVFCIILGHNNKYVWDEEFHPGFGRVDVEKQVCTRCGYKIPTGRDRPGET